eukprot:15461188-Alexandrium_andersonii.AAC.1
MRPKATWRPEADATNSANAPQATTKCDRRQHVRTPDGATPDSRASGKAARPVGRAGASAPSN